MVSRVYIESELRDHPRARRLLQRLHKLPVTEIEFYGEVFNPRAQNFRLQKKNPALIIARKNRGQVLAAPDGYGLGGDFNYYFSHMLNCIYDCRYCFLQGMYQSAHQVLFVNYEDFGEQIRQTAAAHPHRPVWFYSGYDCDSLANEPMTRFTEYFVPLIASIDNAWMELRTKSTQVRSMLQMEPVARVVTAFSFSDRFSHSKLEHGVPAIDKRVDAMRRLLDAGWPVGLRFDPVVYHRDYQNAFVELLQQVFAKIDASRLHSVSLGSFRLTRDHFRRISRLYPEEPLFAQNMQLDNGIISYPLEREQAMIEFCEAELMKHIPAESYHPCEWHG
ncbi:MAG: DNA photolyase [Gammaproteobacteria bacterium]|nr:MAG: DNA photolyase [Gammaproteobacteria bacterium]UCH39478.1 MAG: DNA photolyase [Gammaproteobacteria bacterium]